MKPVNFEERNILVVGGENSNDLHCWQGKGYNGKDVKASKWKLTFWERLKVFFGCPIWLWNYSQNNSPVALSAEFQPFKGKDQPSK